MTGTSAGSFVGSIYASGKSPYQLQQLALQLQESDLRDLTLNSQGIVLGQKLQDYVNKNVGNKPIEKFPMRFAAVATRLDNGKKADFILGNAGQAVVLRAVFRMYLYPLPFVAPNMSMVAWSVLFP